MARSTWLSIRASPSGPAPIRRPGCASSCCWSSAERGEAAGPLTDLGTGSGLLAIAAAKLGWAPVTGYDHQQAAIEAAAANAAANGVEIELVSANLRDRPAAARPDERREPDRLCAPRRGQAAR